MFREDFTTPDTPPVTYSLRAGERSSAGYYEEITGLADEMLRERAHTVQPLLERYTEWLSSTRRETLRSDLEYTVDVLTLGILWQQYGGRALRVFPPFAWLLILMFRTRRAFPRLKERIDVLRAVLLSRVLGPGRKPDAGEGIPSIYGMYALLRWMDATGEYREEVRRLRVLVSYLTSCDAIERSWYLMNALTYAAHFDLIAGKRLRRFTSGVGRFLRETAQEHDRMEDALLVSRRPVEYHLAMFGAELLNRAFRTAYEASGERAVLLPACMRGEHADGCRAQRDGLDMVCAGCSPNCRVNTLSRLAARRGVETHLIPHSSDFSTWLKHWAADRDIGVVGVACALHLMTGGLELRERGIPAQCVLLDYSGCSQHWDPAGRETRLNEDLLLDTMTLGRNVGSDAVDS